MSYMLLIVEEPNGRSALPPGEGERRMEQMVRWGQSLHARGLLTASDALRSEKEAVRVQVRDGRQSLRDGPFAEAKEMIGGFFLLTCNTREEAVAIATECPAAAWLTVEVREIGNCAEG